MSGGEIVGGEIDSKMRAGARIANQKGISHRCCSLWRPQSTRHFRAQIVVHCRAVSRSGAFFANRPVAVDAAAGFSFSA